ncbi:MAG: type II toxin-antitoxin system VapC family toxin [Xanthomonadaceae bacterium]|nr:type II toxin-antitoxin system VapC family toxin [Xanthomonadaceae bacterium]MDE1886370.1 type II toxin-antitoxin system VapC family toxin [Xanthomonadaceae bacterium]MDE1960571.1 type II toxin-antitoxin system VapC family toxin [Xanthomonadaceae bacterium]MDE2084003.1 type II toxin-antitoxin system VapC family toxin [Xanthomonadaceae bacterium]MDE2258661.1 type II toxin-antitoxin system VapC family toxin [Xanthomonadaceae bacterium]
MRYLLDTNICIYIARHRPAEVQKRFERLKAGDAAVSAVTFGELQYGAAKSRQAAIVKTNLEEFAGFVPVLALDAACARAYGEIRAELESAGRVIGSNDLWIAAHARSAQLILVTNNEREFKRVPGLKIENWVATQS